MPDTFITHVTAALKHPRLNVCNFFYLDLLSLANITTNKLLLLLSYVNAGSVLAQRRRRLASPEPMFME